MAKRLLIALGVLTLGALCLSVLLTGLLGTGFDEARASEIDIAWRGLEAVAAHPGPAAAVDGPTLADQLQTVLALAREPREGGWYCFRGDRYRMDGQCAHVLPPDEAVTTLAAWLERPGPKPLALGSLDGVAREALMLDLNMALVRFLRSGHGDTPAVQRGLYALARSLVDEPSGRRWNQLGMALLLQLLDAQAERAPLPPAQAQALLPSVASLDAALCRAALDDASYYKDWFETTGVPGMLGSHQLIDPIRQFVAGIQPYTDAQLSFLHTALKQRLLETVHGTMAPSTGSVTPIDCGLAMITLDPPRGVDMLGTLYAGIYVEAAALQQRQLLKALTRLDWPRPQLLGRPDERVLSGNLVAHFVDGW